MTNHASELDYSAVKQTTNRVSLPERDKTMRELLIEGMKEAQDG